MLRFRTWKKSLAFCWETWIPSSADTQLSQARQSLRNILASANLWNSPFCERKDDVMACIIHMYNTENCHKFLEAPIDGNVWGVDWYHQMQLLLPPYPSLLPLGGRRDWLSWALILSDSCSQWPAICLTVGTWSALTPGKRCLRSSEQTQPRSQRSGDFQRRGCEEGWGSPTMRS